MKSLIINNPLKYARMFAGALGVTAAMTTMAGEQAIGDDIEINGMTIAAVYLQAVKMAPALPGMQSMDLSQSIHLEADIHANEKNTNGFGAGEWVPYLSVAYHLTKEGSDWSSTGTFMPMVASDGAHYGANIKLEGPGKYHLSYEIYPPAYNGMSRHFDKETGVESWWQPFSLEWDFTYLGTGKKGGY